MIDASCGVYNFPSSSSVLLSSLELSDTKFYEHQIRAFLISRHASVIAGDGMRSSVYF